MSGCLESDVVEKKGLCVPLEIILVLHGLFDGQHHSKPLIAIGSDSDEKRQIRKVYSCAGHDIVTRYVLEVCHVHQQKARNIDEVRKRRKGSQQFEISEGH